MVTAFGLFFTVQLGINTENPSQGFKNLLIGKQMGKQ
jgi:hypothetical protein